MATSLQKHIIATFVGSCIIVALLIAAFATPQWVLASIKARTVNDWNNDLNYGLFSGQITGYRGSVIGGDLKMSCDLGENVCVVSCLTDSDGRTQELNSLLNNYRGVGCPFAFSNDGACQGACEGFINAGLWSSSIAFLAIALLLGVTAGVFAVVNATTNPVEPILSVKGLYVWNGGGAFSTLLVLVLWGSLFNAYILDNVGYSETVTGQYITTSVSLGVSYWLVLVALLLFLVNIAILKLREYQLAREPPPPTIKMEENTDGIIFLY
ncbi:hypothetical protein C0J52_00611 [Blattella germanica]|nr:hypothetical protein C0J52_00611 [Blattella germanica]